MPQVYFIRKVKPRVGGLMRLIPNGDLPQSPWLAGGTTAYHRYDVANDLNANGVVPEIRCVSTGGTIPLGLESRLDGSDTQGRWPFGLWRNFQT